MTLLERSCSDSLRVLSNWVHKLVYSRQQGSQDNNKGIPHAAAEAAIGIDKGIGRIITSSLKSPMLVMHGVARDFHNLPRTYSEDVREYGSITSLRNGLLGSTTTENDNTASLV